MSEDVADLAALVEYLDIGPVWVVGASSGANIALRLVSQRPDILRGVIAHEPGFFSLLEGDSTFSSMLDKVDQLKGIVLERIAEGDHAGAAKYFIEANLGPDAWERTPTRLKRMFIQNAPTFLDDMKDPEHFAFDPNWFKGFSKAVLLTQGDQSPPFLAPVVARLVEALPQAEVVTYTGAGHTPHSTHPDAYVELITTFIRKHAE
jgi:pimeloyl-ACP methyl ester carboxylesterase